MPTLSRHDIIPIWLTDFALGSPVAVAMPDGAVVRQSFSPWGIPRDPFDWTAPYDTALVAGRGFTGHQHLEDFGLIDMGGRVYDPALGRFLSPDPFVQAPTNSQNFNRYAYCLNNPLIYTDPDGEFFWMPIIIGAAFGAFNGYMIGSSLGATGWNMFGYVVGGAFIGGLSSGAAVGVSALGGAAWWAGAAAGAVGNAGFTWLANGWDTKAIIRGAAFGAISGFVGGGVGSAIGGGWGALAGGASSNLTSQLLYNKGNFSKVNWASVGLSGVMSYGVYELASYIGWKKGDNNLGDNDISYKQYKTMQADFQRSRFWGKEYGGFLLKDGSVQKFPASWRHSHGITPPDGSGIEIPDEAFAMYHTHWDAPGKTIWVDSMGNRVDNSSDPLALLRPGLTKTVTERSHGDYDFLSIDSYVINRFETSFNNGGTINLTTYKDSFLRFFPWFTIYF